LPAKVTAKAAASASSGARSGTRSRETARPGHLAGSRTVTACPAERRAAATDVPDTRDTSRSSLSPPARTVTRTETSSHLPWPGLTTLRRTRNGKASASRMPFRSRHRRTTSHTRHHLAAAVGKTSVMSATAPAKVPLDRFVFVLPEPLPFSDGTRFSDHIGDKPDAVPRPDDPWVSLTIRQEHNSFGRTAGSMKAMNDVVRRTPDLSVGADDGEGHAVQDSRNGTATPASLPIPYTVVDAVTQSESPDHSAEPVDKAQDLAPRVDAFNRCLRFATDLVRAYRVVDSALIGPPTYERVPHPVLAYQADAELVHVNEEGVVGVIIGVPEGGWSEPYVMQLEHYNLPDQVIAEHLEADRLAKFNHYMEMLRYGNPFLQWNEMYLDARRALYVHGDYSSAVVLALTASEVMLDALLSLLLWEAGETPERAAGRFEERKITRRVRTDLAGLLGGNWNLDGAGPPGQWFRTAVRLRHRVVHGGYRPSRLEASAAVQAVLDMERHAFARLIERRGTYPRSTLMTVAESGLRARNAWKGKIRTFAEDVAPSEPSWQDSFADWRDRLTELTLQSQ
jgi:hypothetical protein